VGVIRVYRMVRSLLVYVSIIHILGGCVNRNMVGPTGLEPVTNGL